MCGHTQADTAQKEGSKTMLSEISRKKEGDVLPNELMVAKAN